MDKHDLTPLFSPTSIVVFAGDAGAPASQTALARSLLANCGMVVLPAASPRWTST